MLRRLTGKLPATWQHELRRANFAWQIRRGRFVSPEPDFHRVDSLLSPGDWVLDAGANVGHYTARFSRAVGPTGRVIAFEPVPSTFAILASNMIAAGCSNVTLVNAALSNAVTEAHMSVPGYADGRPNFYQARLTTGAGLSVMTLAADQFALHKKIRLVKIDTEGHELAVLQGMVALLRRDRPVLIVEDSSREIGSYLQAFGYESQRLPGSPNRIYMHA
jgi:FkbM family methyltransferase